MGIENLANTLFYNVFYFSFIIISAIFFGYFLSKISKKKNEVSKKKGVYKPKIKKSKFDIDKNKEIEEKEEIEVVQKKVQKKLRHKEIEDTDIPPNVLIAEDNLVNAKILIKVLGKLNIHSYTHAMDGKEAFEIIKSKKENFDVVLMDINMPIMTGDEATIEIIEWERENDEIHTPIVAVTANALLGDRERFLSVGMDDYTTKPINIASIENVIRNHTGYSK